MTDISGSVNQSEFFLFVVTLHCHVLSNGQRIIDADDVEKLFEAMGVDGIAVDGKAITASMEAFARWLKGLGP